MEDLIIGLVIVVILLVIGSMRSGKSQIDSKPSKLMSFDTQVSDSQVLKIVVDFAQRTGYDIETIDESKKRICLSDSATMTSMGFFYPIFISSGNSGSTLVEVGIRSKTMMVGPVVTQHLEKCFNGIRAAVYVQDSVLRQITIDDNRMKCPYCAELILPDAKLCRYCGRELPSPKTNSISNPVSNKITTQPDTKATCPKCGISMMITTAKKGQYRGKQFYVCPNYKQCHQFFPVEE
jgi:Zn finger protein HypA/HybF involved in hydrogenase expression